MFAIFFISFEVIMTSSLLVLLAKFVIACAILSALIILYSFNFPINNGCIILNTANPIFSNVRRSIRSPPINEGASPKPEDKVLALIECELKSVLGETGAAMTVLVYEWRSLKEENQQHILKLRELYEDLWISALNEAKDAGLVVIEPFVLRRLLTGALSWTVNWYRQEGDMTIDQLAQMTLSLAIKPA